MLTIQIVVCPQQSSSQAFMTKKTWIDILSRKTFSPVVPPGNWVQVGDDPFAPDYLLVLVDQQLEEGKFYISQAIKDRFYKDRDVLEF
jgi:hypothetical protein